MVSLAAGCFWLSWLSHYILHILVDGRMRGYRIVAAWACTSSLGLGYKTVSSPKGFNLAG